MHAVAKCALSFAGFLSFAAPSAFATSVSPDIEGSYRLTASCPQGAGATLCKADSGPFALTVMEVNGQTVLGIATVETQIPLYLFTVSDLGADPSVLAAGPSQSVYWPASIHLQPGADGTTLVGTLHDPSSPGPIALEATRSVSLASCTQSAGAWTAGPKVSGTYPGMVNGSDGAGGTLLIQEGGDGGHGLTAAFNSEWATPLYFQSVTPGERSATLTLTHLPSPADWFGGTHIKWCLASTDGRTWNGWAYGTNAYLVPLSFARQ